MFTPQVLLLGGLLAATVGAEAPDGPFGLYAYGGGLGGAQLFYSNEMAFVGDQSKVDDEEAASVVFTTGENNELIANPNMTSSRAVPSWSDKSFFIPAATSSSHTVGFTSDPDDADVSTSGFIFYEDSALHLDQGESGSLSSLWYVVPTTTKRVWSLHWNATQDRTDGHLAVNLRSVAPAKPWDHSGL